jgi:hypothetical protein
MDFWSAYMHNHNEQAFRPMSLIKLPLIELPQVRLPQSCLLYRTHVASDRLYSSSSPTTIVNTPLPGVSPSCTTIIDVIHG